MSEQEKTALVPQISQEVIALYDEYTHAPLPRRTFLNRLSVIAGSTAAASALLPFLENNYAHAQTVAADDSRIVSEKITYPGDAGDVKAVLSYPKGGAGKFPAVIVIHENRGLNPHTEDVGRRFAAAGYLSLSIDYLSPAGGTPSNEDTARDMIGKLDPKQTVGNSVAAVKFLKSHAKSTGKVGVVGFCWGGGQVNALAVAAPDLNAGVVFYGATPKLEDVPKIKAPLLVNLGALDERINAMYPPYEAALKAANKSFVVYIYPDVNHAFFNDTNAARYNEPAAKLAWDRTLAFFAKNLA